MGGESAAPLRRGDRRLANLVPAAHRVGGGVRSRLAEAQSGGRRHDGGDYRERPALSAPAPARRVYPSRIFSSRSAFVSMIFSRACASRWSASTAVMVFAIGPSGASVANTTRPALKKSSPQISPLLAPNSAVSA